MLCMCAVATLNVDDPIKVVTKTVGPSGQVYVGKEFIGEDILVVVTKPGETDYEKRRKNAE